MLENKKILILDHAIFVNEIQIHGPGLNIYRMVLVNLIIAGITTKEKKSEN